MKIFLVIVVCLEGLCQNYVTTDPVFDSYSSCRAFSMEAVDKIRDRLPDSSGNTYCVSEGDLKQIAEELMKKNHDILEKLDTNI